MGAKLMSPTALRRYEADDQQWPFLAGGNELAPTISRSVAVTRPQLSSPTVVHRSAWARPTIDRFVTLASLKDNWDQRGSAAVRGDVLSFAWTILAQIMPSNGMVPNIVPLGNGGIQIEWSSHDSELDMEITRPFRLSAFFFDSGSGEEIETSINTDNLEGLAQLIQQHFQA
jgi:hypothetical protein